MTRARWEIAFVVLTGLGKYLLAGWLEHRLTFHETNGWDQQIWISGTDPGVPPTTSSPE